MRIFLLIALLVALAGIGWLAHQNSRRHCRETALWAAGAGAAALWWEEAARERFLAPSLREGPTADFLRQMKNKLVSAGKDPFSWHLSRAVKADLRALDALGERDFARWPAALKALAARDFSRCGVKGQDMEASLAEAQAHWRRRRGQIVAEKWTFALDRAVFCRSDRLISRLGKVLQATEAKCSQNCERVTRPLRQEMVDLEKQKEMNRRKLERKWPVEVLEDLRCSAS